MKQEKESKLLSVKHFAVIPEHERFNQSVVLAHNRFLKSGLGENRKEADRFNREVDKAAIRLRGNTYANQGSGVGALVGGSLGGIGAYKINPKSLPLGLALSGAGGIYGAVAGGLIGSRIEKKHKTYPNGVRFEYARKLKELSARRQQMIEFSLTNEANTRGSVGRFKEGFPYPLDVTKDKLEGSFWDANAQKQRLLRASPPVKSSWATRLKQLVKLKK
jgi:hypothetical protein